MQWEDVLVALAGMREENHPGITRNVMALYGAAHQRFFLSMFCSAKVGALVEYAKYVWIKDHTCIKCIKVSISCVAFDCRSKLAENFSIVISVQSTGESAMKDGSDSPARFRSEY
jgi:hypothetical protein